jgi:hypothetical protein
MYKKKKNNSTDDYCKNNSDFIEFDLRLHKLISILSNIIINIKFVYGETSQLRPNYVYRDNLINILF